MSQGGDRWLRPLGLALAALALLPLALLALEVVGFALGRPALIGFTEGVVGEVCHRDPARTLELGGRLLPVCARCTGLYLAASISGAIGLGLGGRRSRLLPLLGIAGLAAAVGLTAAVLEAAGLLSTSNPTRLVLGLALGLAPSLLLGLGARVLIDEASTPADGR